MINRNRKLALLLISGMAVLLGACANQGSGWSTGSASTGMRAANEKQDASDPAVVDRAKFDMLVDYRSRVNAAQEMTFAEFEATVYREANNGKYIVDGDTPITDRKHLQEFFETKVKQLHRPDVSMGELIVHSPGGVDAVWDDTQKLNLSYCVSIDFGNQYNTVVNAMNAAAGAWEAAANINFVHDSAQDSNCTATNPQVLFDVRPVNGESYLARAFFPDDFRSNRNVLINDSSFALDPTGNLSLTGILRHELGHTLGFRHEHTRPNAGTCFEDSNWSPLTDYDEFSTMHYPQCNGGGDWSLELTETDRSGAACQYGEAPGFSIDPNICTPQQVQPTTTACACGPQVVTASGSVNSGESKQIGSYEVAAGTELNVEMIGSGDPDLYVRFNNPPSLSRYDCRPYTSGATESCNLTVPVGALKAFVMLRGYAAGTYQLTIEHSPNP